MIQMASKVTRIEIEIVAGRDAFASIQAILTGHGNETS